MVDFLFSKPNFHTDPRNNRFIKSNHQLVILFIIHPK